MESKTVLMVDDDVDTREAYTLLLQRAGYRVLEAAHGGDAIRLARERNPDLIILDLGMPVVDGCEAATSLREYRDTAEIPILTITGREPAQIPERLAAVCDGMLRKPCSCRPILTRVRRLIGPAARRLSSGPPEWRPCARSTSANATTCGSWHPLRQRRSGTRSLPIARAVTAPLFMLLALGHRSLSAADREGDGLTSERVGAHPLPISPVQNRWYRRLLPGTRTPGERPRATRAGDHPRRLPPMLGVFAGLALVLVATVLVAVLFRDNWAVEHFGPNLATELLGIIITVAFVQRLLQREERARKLRATVGALRKGRTALASLIEVWSRLVKGVLDPRQTEYPLNVEQLFASYYTEALAHLSPTLSRESADAARISLGAAAAQLTAAQRALRDIIFIYGGALDPDYLEAVDELADDAFVALIVELAAVESLTPQEWRIRINTSRGYREAFFIRLLHAIQVHNRLAVEAAKFRSHLLGPRAQYLSMRLRPDQDLTVDTQLTRQWWVEPPALGALRGIPPSRAASGARGNAPRPGGE